ncbi:MAG: pyridoxamine 5'-phosphate oxidase family protein [Planctomycetes bacterium]|nr:pyridoxamine 5'-phosphate oxidase family protein [Planctomycetota bacterium]
MDGTPQAMRHLFAQERHAVLATAHAAHDGWPFASLVPYAELADGDAVVLLADIAEHTANLRADGRATLFVADPDARERPQAGARIALMVQAEQPTGADADAIAAVYAQRFPRAAGFAAAHGFGFWRLRVDRVRWIAGFGAAGFWTREQWAAGIG